ncbi:MAG: hypothetical protein A2Z97_03310 [Bdellovibrionales bacterium GWB1_52_6]|nr:MAG: hypothetical protein A2Z97_03310 [Bdellovibrionales bacterium GWB1_52_6]OFZ02901.1 MAG: hypothetical protein A2X97_04835 [Bdellovibrionales bacterium GWA1_52_35]
MFAVFLLIVFVLYGFSLPFPFFIFDDPQHIYANPIFHPVKMESLQWIFSESIMSLPYALWAALASIFGTANPIPYRSLNLLLHGVNSALAFLVLKQLLPLFWAKKPEYQKYTTAAALLGATLFCVHPVQVETVVWISCLKDLLAGLFSLLALWLFLKTMSSPDLSVPNRRLGLAWSAIILLMGMFAKISAAGYALVLIWLHQLFFRTHQRKAFALISLLLLGFAAAFYTVYVHHVPETLLPFIPTAGQRLFIASDAFLFNLRQLFIPYEYFFLHGRTPLRVLLTYSEAPLITSVLLIGLLGALAVLAWGAKNPRLRAAHGVIFLILLSTLPTLGAVPFAHQNLSTTADHYLYLAVLGVALAAGLAFPLVLKARKPLSWISIFVLVAAFTTKTWVQQKIWKDSESCIQYTLDVAPLSDTAHDAAGYLRAKGGQLNEAVEHFAAAQNIRNQIKIITAESLAPAAAESPRPKLLPDFWSSSQ